MVAAGGTARGGAQLRYLTRVGGGAAAPLADSARDALVDAATGAPRARGAEAWQKGAPAAASPSTTPATSISAWAREARRTVFRICPCPGVRRIA